MYLWYCVFLMSLFDPAHRCKWLFMNSIHSSIRSVPKAVISDLWLTQGWNLLRGESWDIIQRSDYSPLCIDFWPWYVLTFPERFALFFSVSEISRRFRPIRSVDVPYRSLNVPSPPLFFLHGFPFVCFFFVLFCLFFFVLFLCESSIISLASPAARSKDRQDLVSLQLSRDRRQRRRLYLRPWWQQYHYH